MAVGTKELKLYQIQGQLPKTFIPINITVSAYSERQSFFKAAKELQPQLVKKYSWLPIPGVRLLCNLLEQNCRATEKPINKPEYPLPLYFN